MRSPPARRRSQASGARITNSAATAPATTSATVCIPVVTQLKEIKSAQTRAAHPPIAAAMRIAQIT